MTIDSQQRNSIVREPRRPELVVLLNILNIGPGRQELIVPLNIMLLIIQPLSVRLL